MKLKAVIQLEPNSRKQPVIFKPTFSTGDYTARCTVNLQGKLILQPGQSGDVEIILPATHRAPKLQPGTSFVLYEGLRKFATGRVKRAS